MRAPSGANSLSAPAAASSKSTATRARRAPWPGLMRAGLSWWKMKAKGHNDVFGLSSTVLQATRRLLAHHRPANSHPRYSVRVRRLPWSASSDSVFWPWIWPLNSGRRSDALPAALAIFSRALSPIPPALHLSVFAVFAQCHVVHGCSWHSWPRPFAPSPANSKSKQKIPE